jgi:hypothetical protein
MGPLGPRTTGSIRHRQLNAPTVYMPVLPLSWHADRSGCHVPWPTFAAVQHPELPNSERLHSVIVHPVRTPALAACRSFRAILGRLGQHQCRSRCWRAARQNFAPPSPIAPGTPRCGVFLPCSGRSWCGVHSFEFGPAGPASLLQHRRATCPVRLLPGTGFRGHATMLKA